MAREITLLVFGIGDEQAQEYGVCLEVFLEELGAEPAKVQAIGSYFKCAETSLVISNIVTSFLPPKIGFSLSSARMLRLFWGF
jgi:hypothetical protein